MLRACWLGAAMVALVSAVATAAPPVDPYRAMAAPRIEPNNQIDLALIADPPAEPSEYWLGIECLPVPGALRAQLSLPEKQGLLVEGIAPNSPAAKAGIERYDILLRAGDKPLTEPRELVEAVQAAKDAKLAIELIRGGQHKTIEATPAKRPDEARRPLGMMPAPGDWETMQKWIDQMQRTPGSEEGESRGPLHFRLLRPGAILPPGAFVDVESPLPPNMSISVSKEADQPAKIVVKRGNDKWEITEKELDKLPADVRPHVEHMLGHGGLIGALEDDAVATPPGVPGEPPSRSSRPDGERVEKPDR